jgi:hypothetical protein
MDDGIEQNEPVPGLPRATGLAIGAALARVYAAKMIATAY